MGSVLPKMNPIPAAVGARSLLGRDQNKKMS